MPITVSSDSPLAGTGPCIRKQDTAEPARGNTNIGGWQCARATRRAPAARRQYGSSHSAPLQVPHHGLCLFAISKCKAQEQDGKTQKEIAISESESQTKQRRLTSRLNGSIQAESLAVVELAAQRNCSTHCLRMIPNMAMDRNKARQNPSKRL